MKRDVRILVQFANGLGNFVMFTPALRALRLAKPNAGLDVLVTTNKEDPGRWEQIVSLVRCYSGGLIDDVIEHERSEPFDASPWNLRVVPYHGEPNATRDAILAAGSVTNRRPDWPRQHEVEHLMELAYSLGYVGPVPRMEAPEPTEGYEPCVVICNGSNPAGAYRRKRWIDKRWTELAGILRHWCALPVVAVGGPGEFVGDEHTVDLAGAGFLATINALHAASLVVTTDSFTMHLAAAIGTPLVALFGPTLLAKNRPWTESPVEIVRADLTCQPCQLTERWHLCAGASCMEAIEVPDVMAAVRKLERRILQEAA